MIVGGQQRGWGTGFRALIRSSFSPVVVNEAPAGRPAVPWVLAMASGRVRGDQSVPGTTRLRSVPPPITVAPDDPERDRALMRRVLEGDEDAFAGLYDLYAAQVNGVAMSVLRRPALAEEVTHDVFLRVWQQPAAFDPARGTFAGWLLRVARNRAIDVLRQRREDSGNGPDGDVTSWIVDPAPGPEDEALDRMRREVVREALRALTPDHRQVLELAYFTGMSQSQIAAHLDRPLGTVKSQIRTAMGRLADRLASSGELIGSDSFSDREDRA